MTGFSVSGIMKKTPSVSQGTVLSNAAHHREPSPVNGDDASWTAGARQSPTPQNQKTHEKPLSGGFSTSIPHVAFAPKGLYKL